MAIQVTDHSIAHNDFEGETDGGWVRIWDRGTYEQGGRVPWPEALERGHAVFVLHGERLRAASPCSARAAARSPVAADQAQGRRARPGSDVVAEGEAEG